MIRDDRFLISQRPYAVDLSSLRVETRTRMSGPDYYSATIDAVWFRRRKSITVACIGELWDFQDERPTDGRMFLEQLTDGRYGGRCAARWDGTGYWGAEAPDVAAAHLEVLRPMLAGYPALVEGYDGWWRF